MELLAIDNRMRSGKLYRPLHLKVLRVVVLHVMLCGQLLKNLLVKQSV